MNTFKTGIRLLMACFPLVLVFGCFGSGEVSEVKRYPLNSLEGVITQDEVQFDREVSTDLLGALRINANNPRTFYLYETGDLDVENGKLIYQAKVRTKDMNGKAYLEMWCHVPGKGEFFSRGLHSFLSGTNDWTTQEIVFYFKRGENPDNVKLNIVLNGQGTVWIDDIRLLKGPAA